MTGHARKTLSPDMKERLNRLIRGLVETRGVRHAVVPLGRSDGSPLWLGSAGAALPYRFVPRLLRTLGDT